MADISYYIDQQVCVIQIKGQIINRTIASISEEMKPLIEEVKNGQWYGIIMDCRQVNTIDSAGFGGICAMYLTLKKVGKKLRVANLSENTRRFFDTSKLTQAFETHKSVAALIQSMAPRFVALNNSAPTENWRSLPEDQQPGEKTLKDFSEN